MMELLSFFEEVVSKKNSRKNTMNNDIRTGPDPKMESHVMAYLIFADFLLQLIERP